MALGLRKKIFVSYIVLFLIFIALMFPFSTKTVNRIVFKSMDDRTTEIIEKIKDAQDNNDLIKKLKDQKPLLFFRVSVISNEHKVLYDSHAKRVLGPKFSQDFVVDHPEVNEAFQNGQGYFDDYSTLLGQKFTYFAKAFQFHGKTYVLRTAFPYKYVVEITRNFEIGFLALSVGVLLLFSIMTWFIIYRLTTPIDQIIRAIKPYEEGRLPHIPEIRLRAHPGDDFGRLASALNSLSQKVKLQIDDLTKQKNEKGILLESLVEGVIAVDQEGKVTYANRMAAKLLNLPENELINKPFSVTKQSECETLLFDSMREQKPLTLSLQIQLPISKMYLEVIAVPINDGSGAILVMQDKTSHYKILEMRRDFVANASHELKTPITIIRGFAEAMYDNPDLPREMRLEITDKMVRNCQRMTNLIRNLMSLSDIENLPRFRLVESNLKEIAERCREMVLELYPEAEIAIENLSEEDVYMMCEPDLIEQAFINLMNNAAKYSQAPAQITVSLAKDEDSVKISVADKGIGIPAQDLEYIFQRFYTVDKARSRKLGGSGLGLSIVETIVQKHCGRISAESLVGVGTTFTIVFPTQLAEMI